MGHGEKKSGAPEGSRSEEIILKREKVRPQIET
jgi:hypothetical protein